jgi:hypothetical protein
MWRFGGFACGHRIRWNLSLAECRRGGKSLPSGPESEKSDWIMVGSGELPVSHLTPVDSHRHRTMLTPNVEAAFGVTAARDEIHAALGGPVVTSDQSGFAVVREQIGASATV